MHFAALSNTMMNPSQHLRCRCNIQMSPHFKLRALAASVDRKSLNAKFSPSRPPDGLFDDGEGASSVVTTAAVAASEA